MANVIFKVGTRAQYDKIQPKDALTLYWLEDEQALYKGDKLFGIGTLASEKAAGLLSAHDYTKLQELIRGGAIKKKYEITNGLFEDTRVSYKEDEIRVCFSKDTKFVKQNGNGDSNSYYFGFRAYAPEKATGFKEDLAEIISDDTLYRFENNPYAGIDKDGRKYSIVWLPAAKLKDDVWNYYGKASTKEHYIGWFYTIEWYNDAGQVIESNTIRINLSNEQCHNNVEPFYMGRIDANKLYQEAGETIELYGGSATDNI